MATMRLKDSNFDLFEDGVYELTLKEVVERAQQTDPTNKFLSWNYDVIAPPDYAGRVYSTLTPVSFGPKSKHFKELLALGFDPAATGDGERDLDLNMFVGRTAIAEIHTVTGPKSGKDSNQFKNIWSPEEFAALQAKMFSVGRPKTEIPPAASTPPPAVNTKTVTPPPAAAPKTTVKQPSATVTKSTAVDDFPE